MLNINTYISKALRPSQTQNTPFFLPHGNSGNKGNSRKTAVPSLPTASATHYNRQCDERDFLVINYKF